jgi:hypothetical protein
MLACITVGINLAIEVGGPAMKIVEKKIRPADDPAFKYSTTTFITRPEDYLNQAVRIENLCYILGTGCLFALPGFVLGVCAFFQPDRNHFTSRIGLLLNGLVLFALGALCMYNATQ